MNKQQITKQYSTILICLALVSMLIMFATPFVAAFEMDLGLISGSETGMDYITNMFDFEEKKSNSSKNDWFDEDKFSDYTLIEEDIEKWIMRVLVAGVLVYAVINFIKAVSSFSDKNQNNVINKMLFLTKTGLGWNIAYYVFCMYIIFKGHEWDFEVILSGDAIVKTKTYLPMIFQIIVVVAAIFIHKHWCNVLSGKTAPLNFGFGATVDSNQAPRTEQAPPRTEQAPPRTEQAPPRTNNNTYSTQYEIEKMELLKRYKELLDSGIITEEEFKEKKNVLLGKNTNNTDFQEELSRICDKCGYPLTSSQQVCPNCGTRLINETQSEEYGMKWYKFLIYFSLFASAVVNAILAIVYLTGAHYNGSEDLVYNAYPSMKAIDAIYGILLIGLAIMALVTRSALNWNKKKGPKLLCALYVLDAVVGLLYSIIVSSFTGEFLSNGTILVTLGASIVMAIVNSIYFEKRKDMFIY